jgi:hypothetical protein
MKNFMPPLGDMKGVEGTDLNAFLADVKRDAPPNIRWGLVLSAWIYLLTPILTVWIPLPAFLLPAKLRDKHTDRFSTHRLYLIRSCSLMIKMMAGMCWGRDPEIRRALGCEELPPDPGTWRVGE